MGYHPPKWLWVMGYHGFMGYPLQTNSGSAKIYGLSRVMGFGVYGLEGSRLYITDLACSTVSSERILLAVFAFLW